jgi:hypothetical protein
MSDNVDFKFLEFELSLFNTRGEKNTIHQWRKKYRIKKIFLKTNKPPTFTIPFLEILCLLTIQDIKSLIIKFGATK